MDQEEVHSTHIWECRLQLHQNLFSWRDSLLLSCNFHCATLSGGSCVIWNRTLKGLVSSRDNFVKRELNGSNEIMAREVLEIIKVVNVVDFCFIVLTLLEMILDIETFYPSWVQVVHDDFGHSNFVPLVINLPVQYDHTIGSRKCVHVWKVFGREG